tara:strand:+ start:395 stop:1387 length:993 start_codon:yes stop_codon:yes gene_type:complete
MIISRTPYRISLFGGGTDYPDWYIKNGGQVLSTSIDKYIYLSCRTLPSFFKHRYRILYALDEKVTNIKSIIHPSVRETLKYLKIKNGMEIHYDGDLPARSGLGSSSAFTVGLVNCLKTLLKEKISKNILAQETLYIEQNLVKETVGSQDQIATAYGGLNHIKFNKNGNFSVQKLDIPSYKIKNLENNLVMFYTDINRRAELIAKTYVNNINKLESVLHNLNDSVNKAKNILRKGSLDDIGYMMDEFWQEKKKLSDKVSNPLIDKIYNKAKSSGALGGKILGAGGGGFLLFYVPLRKKENLKKALSNFVPIDIKFEKSGSKIIYNSNSNKN